MSASNYLACHTSNPSRVAGTEIIYIKMIQNMYSPFLLFKF